MFGGPDRIEAERLHELAHIEGVIHVRGVRDRRRAGVVLPQQTLPVALVVAGHHHPTVHACAPLPEVVSPGRRPISRRNAPCALSLTVFALIVRKEASLCEVDSCSCLSVFTFDKLREIVRPLASCYSIL